MKIALIVEHFDATRGGASHLGVWLAKQLAQRGHEVHVVCHDVAARVNRYRQATLRASHDADRSQDAYAPAEVTHQGIHIHKLRGMRINTGFGFRRFGARARRWCRANHPDVVHSLTIAFPGDIYHPYVGVYAAMQTQAAASRPGNSSTWKRLLLRLSGKQRTLVALEKRALAPLAQPHPRTRNAPRRILSLCDMMSRQFQHLYGLDPRNIHQLPSPRMDFQTLSPSPSQTALDREWFRSHYRLATDDRVALFVGHDFRRKGLRFAIQAIARTTSWKLLVVGLGKSREYVELAQSLGIGEQTNGDAPEHPSRILFVGPTREMNRVYAAADALLLPTFYDPAGLVALEAFAHGLPVISTEFLGPAELVLLHRAGTIVPTPGSVDLLAAALDALPVAGTPEHQQLAVRARGAGAGLSADRFLDALLALYDTVRRERA